MQDIILDNQLDLSVLNGDIVIDESSEQHQKLILLCAKNDFKENPFLGVGVESFLEVGDSNSLAREISQQFSSDGLKVHKLNVNIPIVEVEASYDS
ncbi:MAG: hypothetical protein RBS07_15750 [Lentimicrobium sp.]|jgi:hypothetical protein|nr:hypothetical protein [Lentimicrobium sp.]